MNWTHLIWARGETIVCQAFSVVRADDDIAVLALANVEFVSIFVIVLQELADASIGCG